MGIEFPIEARALLTIVGIATAAAILALWFKHYLSNWRWTPLAVLGLCMVLAFLAQCIVAEWRPTGAQLLSAGLIGLFGTSLAVFGYEGASNALGLLGVGPRSEEAQVSKAKELLTTQNHRAASPQL